MDIILYSDLDYSVAFSYNEKNDVVRVMHRLPNYSMRLETLPFTLKVKKKSRE
ncbi:MAG: hypothetical protein H0U39_03320 [Segetibacter sp.]|nr:hypothetical protein [Segetibacter sp.]